MFSFLLLFTVFPTCWDVSRVQRVGEERENEADDNKPFESTSEATTRCQLVDGWTDEQIEREKETDR